MHPSHVMEPQGSLHFSTSTHYLSRPWAEWTQLTNSHKISFTLVL